MISARTLLSKGEKDTLALIQSQHSLTHSYTAQVLISMSGKLANKLYICFQEVGGKFGPQI